MQLCSVAECLGAARLVLPVVVAALLCTRGGEGGNHAIFTLGRDTPYNGKSGTRCRLAECVFVCERVCVCVRMCQCVF